MGARARAGAVAALGGTGLAAALAGAWTAHLLAGVFYAAILVPAAWGASLGAALAAGVRWSRWPSRRAALAAGLAAPLLSYAVFHALQNGRLRQRCVERLGGREEYEQVLLERKGSTGFWAELSLRADTGMTVPRRSRGGRRADAPVISGAAMYAYWAVELAVLSAACILFPLRAVRRPFCAHCRRWYVLAGETCVVAARAETALRALERRDFALFAECLVPDGSVHLARLETCPSCGESPARLRLQFAVDDGRGRAKRAVVYDRMLSRESLHSLRSAGFVLRGPRGRPAGR